MMQINLAGARPNVRPYLVAAPSPGEFPIAPAPDEFEALVLATGCDLLSAHIERVFGGEGRTAAELRALLARYVDERIAARRVA